MAAHRGDAETARKSFSAWRARSDGSVPSAEVFDDALEAIIGFADVGPNAIPHRFTDRLKAGTASPPEAHLAAAAAIATGAWSDEEESFGWRAAEASGLVERLAIHDERTALHAFRLRPFAARAQLLDDLRTAFGRGRPRLAITAATWFVAGELRRGAEPPADIAKNVVRYVQLSRTSTARASRVSRRDRYDRAVSRVAARRARDRGVREIWSTVASRSPRACDGMASGNTRSFRTLANASTR